jgi:cell division protein FtsB
VLTVETVLAAARLLREQHAEIVRLREEVLALRGEIWELRSDLELLNDR